MVLSYAFISYRSFSWPLWTIRPTGDKGEEGREGKQETVQAQVINALLQTCSIQRRVAWPRLGWEWAEMSGKAFLKRSACAMVQAVIAQAKSRECCLIYYCKNVTINFCKIKKVGSYIEMCFLSRTRKGMIWGKWCPLGNGR